MMIVTHLYNSLPDDTAERAAQALATQDARIAELEMELQVLQIAIRNYEAGKDTETPF